MPAIPTIEYIERRKKLAEQMKPGSALVVFSAKELMRNADANFLFRQDSYFWYLTGFNEPDSVLVVIKSDDKHFHSILFNRERDVEAEIWNGKRLGQDSVKEVLNIDRAYKIEEIDKHLPSLLNGLDTLYYAQNSYQYADDTIFKTLNKLRSGVKQGLTAPSQIIDWRPILDEMRLFKSEHELKVIRYACEISVEGHLAAMRACKVGMVESQLEGEILYKFSQLGARNPSYNSIVGGGENGCILHYTENNNVLKDNELVLIDAGAEYQNYAGDITRTFPVNGKFTQEQRDIYNIVIGMLDTALAHLKPGNTIELAMDKAIDVLLEGFIKLGILQGDKEILKRDKAYKPFFMHGLSHWLGLDVHDVGAYGSVTKDRPLEPNMVLTVEPGIYIQPNSKNVPSKYWGIGIRVEDDIVITKEGHENLTLRAVKYPDEIELFMQNSRNKANS
ncbi:Xaa-Pro aminopeptidase [Thorsellia kenyensis]|uniref:Xaa-Pro aminopeptidase n=1 Tax=Thorsellia kenyensis TaxID=1549888 RepID=A0ABV6C6M9_9GAMM